MKKIFLYIFLIFLFISNNSYALDVTNQLIKLADLYNSGLITKEEFDEAKKIILKIGDSQSDKVNKAKSEKQKLDESIETEPSKIILDDNNELVLDEDIKIRKSLSFTDQKNFEKMELVVGDYRFYTSRPGGIKVTNFKTLKQLAVIGDNQRVKFFNNSRDVLKIEQDKEKLELKVKLNDTLVLLWQGKYIEKHRAYFYQVLALGYIPFHYYVKKLGGHAPTALNMGKFDRKIELAIVRVKEKLSVEFNISIEQIDHIIKKKNLDAVNKKFKSKVSEETLKIIDEAINHSIDEALLNELERTIGQELSKAFIESIEAATGEAIESALEAELAQAIDEAIQEAISEGISEAAIAAGFAAFFEALAAGASWDEAIEAGDKAACEAGSC